MKHFFEKLKEMSLSVIPLYLVVMILHITVIPFSGRELAVFTVSAILFLLGLALFNLGVEISVERMGNSIGREFTLRKNLPLVIIAGFLIVFVVTFADPQVSVLGQQVFDASGGLINPNLLKAVVSLGCGLFIVLGLLRVYMNISLRKVLFYSYILMGVLGGILLQVNPGFFSVAMDAGGVTTGPLTVPFIMSLGVGVSELSKSKDSQENSFGYVTFALIGPIISVMALGVLFPFDASSAQYVASPIPEGGVIQQIGPLLLQELKNITMAIAPLLIIFLIMNQIFLKIKKRQLRNILVGLIYVYFGIALFLTGVNGGFSMIATIVGQKLALYSPVLLIVVGFILGLIVVFAEPGVWVLNRNVEEVSGGYISSKLMMIALSIAVGLAIVISLIRIFLGIPFWIILVLGYGSAFLLMKKSPPLFTAIAFDSGTVATGPMTATFLLSLAIGATLAIDGNVLVEAFGLVAMVAMMPPIVVQLLGWMVASQEKITKEETDQDNWLESED